MGGGSINNTYQLLVNDHSFFLKTNQATSFPGLFEKEKEGLSFLAAQHCIKTPHVLFCGIHKDIQLLFMNWIPPGNKNKEFWEKFGQQLAQLHRCTHSHFGFASDNHMEHCRNKTVLPIHGYLFS